ncbi:MAG: hypothetical protein ABIJ31_00110 [Pseudomonadota bacterium]
MEAFIEIKPGRKLFQRIYLGIMLWFLGRAIQAASRVDEQVKKEFDSMPDNYTFSLGAFPHGPYMIVGKESNGKVKYLGSDIEKHSVDLEITLKSISLFFVLLSFMESTPIANSRDRMLVSGDVPHACAAVRVLDIVQVYLLPKFIAKLAIKRYPRWSFKRHTLDRAMVLIRTIIGI